MLGCIACNITVLGSVTIAIMTDWYLTKSFLCCCNKISLPNKSLFHCLFKPTCYFYYYMTNLDNGKMLNFKPNYKESDQSLHPCKTNV